MSPTAIMSCGRILLLIAASTQLTSAVPVSSSKEYLGNPASYEEYLTFDDPFQSDDKRAPWAPSNPRSDLFSQKVWELISERNKGKRSKHSEQTANLGDEDFMNLLEFLQPEEQGFNDESNGAQQNEFSKSRAAFKELRGKGGPALYQVDGYDGPKQVFAVYEDPKTKRSPNPYYLGFGQHAASAAMNAFENILDEGKNYRPERPSNPVRFLGKR